MNNNSNSHARLCRLACPRTIEQKSPFKGDLEGPGLIGEALRFVVVGVGATLFSLALYEGLLWCLPSDGALPLVSTSDVSFVLSYVISFVANFFATCHFTFHARPTWGRLVGMVGSHGVNLILQWVLLRLFIRLGCSEALAPLPMYCIAVPVNFLLVRFVFKKA